MNRIDELLMELKSEIEQLELSEKVDMLNKIRSSLKDVSPFIEPVDCIRWIKADNVQANEYNPNKVATPEMKLLHTSIKLDGYTQPIVAYKLENGNYEVVDGFHRNRIGKEYKDISQRIHGYLPLVVLDKPLDERIGSTIRHNRARGTHQIRSMSDIVLDLTRQGWNEEEICKKLGMELDEVIRLKQITGLKDAFQNHTFSKSWEEFETRNYGGNTNE
ncbi:ParB N-terminal domain-containing protein [Clostridium sp.]|uniref:IbrB-like domain-containing protein n=1 Tax=Clostridium sp. TaxID=1506 RepID=UPI00260AF600|nr:ParB N-terminal domain-containing protein [Clostridium sp.]